MSPDLFDISAFLGEPLRLAQVASVSSSGKPLLGSLWFEYDDYRFWFSSQPESPLPAAMSAGSEVAVLVDDFSPPDHIRQVRIRGQGSFEPHDPARVEGIYRRYLGDQLEYWPRQFIDRLEDPGWRLWTVTPDSGIIAHFPNFATHELRWRDVANCPLPRSSAPQS